MASTNYLYSPGTNIQFLMIYGEQSKNSSRPIRADIREKYKNSPCMHCGTTSNIEIDHKNGLYNDERVMVSDTQTADDFQPLCKHCNDQKRQTYVEMKKTGVRYPATRIPALKPFGIDYISGGASFDLNDANTMVGTYWYDPVAFTQEIMKRFQSSDSTSCSL
mgnify:CR=1 FL=1